MGLSLQPARLKRYGEIARLLYKYGRRDLVTRAGLEESLAGGDPIETDDAGDPKDLADDLEAREFLEQLPGRVNRTLDAVANNEIRFNVELIDQGAIITGLQKVANRITLGLLLASLIVGAAMLMRVETTFRIWGYPGFAMVFFLAAAAGGVWLAFNILHSDRPGKQPR